MEKWEKCTVHPVHYFIGRINVNNKKWREKILKNPSSLKSMRMRKCSLDLWKAFEVDFYIENSFFFFPSLFSSPFHFVIVSSYLFYDHWCAQGFISIRCITMRQIFGWCVRLFYSKNSNFSSHSTYRIYRGAKIQWDNFMHFIFCYSIEDFISFLRSFTFSI